MSVVQVVYHLQYKAEGQAKPCCVARSGLPLLRKRHRWPTAIAKFPAAVRGQLGSFRSDRRRLLRPLHATDVGGCSALRAK